MHHVGTRVNPPSVQTVSKGSPLHPIQIFRLKGLDLKLGLRFHWKDSLGQPQK